MLMFPATIFVVEFTFRSLSAGRAATWAFYLDFSYGPDGLAHPDREAFW